MSTATLVTAEEFAQMTFDVPVELVRGEVTEMPRPGGEHGKVATNTVFLLETWARPTNEYEVIVNDTGVVTERGPDTVRGPDVFVIRRTSLPGRRIPKGHFTVSPDLTVEVKSPTDRWSDIIQKVGEYLNCGVLEVWIIDPEHRRVHVYRANDEPDVLNESDQLRSDAVLPGFACTVAELFRGIG